jgi:uncharacterized protein (TIGR02246 family)
VKDRAKERPLQHRGAAWPALAAVAAALTLALVPGARASAASVAPAAATAPPASPAARSAGAATSAGNATSTSATPAASATPSVRAEILDFNRRFAAAGLHMDNAAVMALYADDSVSLLPGMAAMVSRKTIADWLDGLVAEMPGYRVTRNDLEAQDIRIMGDWASEWATTHQVVQPPGGKPPIDTHGKILLVLHREIPGGWKIVQEMWNGAPPPSP